MAHQENVVREKRTNLAITNNLMGPSGKFGIILQAYGEPILRQGSGLLDENVLEDPFEDYSGIEYGTTVSGQNGPITYKDEILNSSDDFLYEEGRSFSGLSRGMHLEIVALNDINQTTVTYKGYMVYKETAGELDAYAPFPDWEDLVEKLYRSGKQKLKNTKGIKEAEIALKIEEKKKSFLEKLRMRWGI